MSYCENISLALRLSYTILSSYIFSLHVEFGYLWIWNLVQFTCRIWLSTTVLIVAVEVASNALYLNSGLKRHFDRHLPCIGKNMASKI